ncbi:Major allergen Mal d 1 family protein [Hibiscus syriacus]|uniref:Major allergen Mal d 1 family protein n=1 Tax=Hibiscus syriacus TaxID=106335 RepID=A0A6A3B4A0_HIBSY|nr:Major allergen Mal d 1 family protein [Hibiscus syriacus]
MPFLLLVRGAKGPIFEDGPNFDMAFRLFHGRNGVVLLSERSSLHAKKAEPETAPPKFNPLAAKAATISLSSFGPGGPFSNQYHPRRDPLHREEILITKHWATSGCKAVPTCSGCSSPGSTCANHFHQELPPSSIDYKAVHAAVPFIAMLWKSVLMPKSAMAFTIGASIFGQVIGSRAERYWLKSVAAKRLGIEESCIPVGAVNPLEGIAFNNGCFGKDFEWNPVHLQVAKPSSSTDMFY